MSVERLEMRLALVAEVRVPGAGVWIQAWGPQGAVEERRVTFPEQRSRKMNWFFWAT